MEASNYKTAAEARVEQINRGSIFTHAINSLVSHAFDDEIESIKHTLRREFDYTWFYLLAPTPNHTEGDSPYETELLVRWNTLADEREAFKQLVRYLSGRVDSGLLFTILPNQILTADKLTPAQEECLAYCRSFEAFTVAEANYIMAKIG